MKSKLFEEFHNLWRTLSRYARLKSDYLKLTAAEKATVLLGALSVSVVILVLGSYMLLLMGFSLVELFRLFMCPALAYLSSAGIFLLLAILVYLLRKPLIINPLSRFLTRTIFSRDLKDSEEWKTKE